MKRGLVVVAMVLAACGSGSGSADPDGGAIPADAASSSSPDAGTVINIPADAGMSDAGPADAGEPKISATASVSYTEFPSTDEKSVDGFVIVERGTGINKTKVGDAVVKVSGTTLTYDAAKHYYPVPSSIPASPGATLKVEVTTTEYTGSLDFTCPQYAITAPAEGDTYNEDTQVNVTWSGEPAANQFFKPLLRIDYWKGGSQILSPINGTTHQVTDGEAAAKAASLKTPATEKAQGWDYVLGLHAYGKTDVAISSAGHTIGGTCDAWRRIHLTAVTR